MSVSFYATRSARATERCEVAVIGAGVCGLGAALELDRAGASVVLIDQGVLGAGASGRNAGYLMRGAADNYAAAVRDWGREGARFLWALSEANQSALIEHGAREAPGFAERPSCLLAASDSEAVELEESAALMREDGFHVDVQAGGEDIVWKHRSWPMALVNPDDFVCDPLELVKMLHAQFGGASFFGAEVFAIEARGDGLVIRTLRCDIACDRAMLCMNAWTGHLMPGLGQLVVPHRAQMVALDASSIDPDLMPRCAYYADHGSEYLRMYDATTLLLGGKRKLDAETEQTGAEHPTAAIQSALERFASELRGAPLPVVHRWSGTMAFTPDGLPIVGSVPLPAASDLTNASCAYAGHGDDRLWVCAGFNGHGMSLGFETGRRAAGAMLGETDAERKIAPLRIERFADV